MIMEIKDYDDTCDWLIESLKKISNKDFVKAEELEIILNKLCNSIDIDFADTLDEHDDLPF